MTRTRLQTHDLRLEADGPLLPDLGLAAGECLLLIDAHPARARRLLRCLAGIESPAAGRIRHYPEAEGLEATWLEPGIRLIDSLNAWDNLLLPARHHALPQALIERRLAPLYPDLTPLRDPHLLPDLLTLVEHRRLLCARALLLAPALLALHHPLAGLAPGAAEAFLHWIHEAAQALGSALALSLQDPLQAAWLAETPILLLDEAGAILLPDWPALLDSDRPVAQDIRNRLCRPCRSQPQPPVPP